MQENTNCYWKQQPIQKTSIFIKLTILYPRLDVIIIRYVQDIPKNVYSRNQARKAIQRHPIIMTDEDYEYVFDEIESREKMSLKEM